MTTDDGPSNSAKHLDQQESEQLPATPSVDDANESSSSEAAAELAAKVSELGESNPKFSAVSETLMAAMVSGPAASPIAKHITSDHVDKALDYGDQRDKRQFEAHSQQQKNEHEDRNRDRIFALLVGAAIVAVVLVVLFLFQDKPDVLIPVISGLGGLLAGFLGGFGFGKSKA